MTRKREFVKKEVPIQSYVYDETVREKQNIVEIHKAMLSVYEEDRQAAHGYVKCHSCNQYFPGSHPEHGYRMCEDCIG